MELFGQVGIVIGELSGKGPYLSFGALDKKIWAQACQSVLNRALRSVVVSKIKLSDDAEAVENGSDKNHDVHNLVAGAKHVESAREDLFWKLAVC